MPLDNIQYFGAIDTIDPLTGEILPKTVTNRYAIGSPVASNTCRVDIGLIPYGDTWADSSTTVKVLNFNTGAIIAELTPKTYGSLPLPSAPGAFDASWINQDKVNAIVWVNAIYSGAVLEVTTKCISTAIMGSWMNQALTYQRNTFNPNVLGYRRGDIIELEPITYDEQITSSSSYPYTTPALGSFMGKSRTYRAQTTFRQYSVRLMSTIDGNRVDPSTVGAIGNQWAVVEPGAIIEEGSNINGNYTLYANGIMECNFNGFTRSIGSDVSMWSPDTVDLLWYLPVSQLSKDFIIAYAYPISGRMAWASCAVYARADTSTKEYVNTSSSWFNGDIRNDVMKGIFYAKSTWY